MASNSQAKKWTDVHIAITAVSVTAVIGMWNLFATPNKPMAIVQEADTPTPPPPAPTETQATVPVQPSPTVLAFRPVKIIYGGLVPNPTDQPTLTATPQQKVVQVNPAAPVKKKKGGGGNGSGSGSGSGSTSSAPPSTGSSKP